MSIPFPQRNVYVTFLTLIIYLNPKIDYMKTLKITLALVAVLVLTVSGVQSEEITITNNSDVNQPTKIDLLAHNKKKVKLPSNG